MKRLNLLLRSRQLALVVRLGPVVMVLVTLALSVASTGVQVKRTEASGNEHRIISGINAQYQRITQSWHGPSHSLDSRLWGNGNPANYPMYWWSLHTAGGNWGWAEIFDYPSSNGCTGYRYELWGSDTDWYYKGQARHLHIYKAAGVGDFNISPNSGWTEVYVGSVRDDETLQCKNAGSWTGAHLHAESDLPSYNSGGTNLDAGDDFDAWDTSNNWYFKLTY